MSNLSLENRPFVEESYSYETVMFFLVFTVFGEAARERKLIRILRHSLVVWCLLFRF